MKLLLDQNISYKLVKKLENLFPDSTHVNLVNLSKSDDIEIWNFAADNNYTILTQDVDFSEIALIKGSPPKVIWLKCGNTRTDYIYQLVIDNFEAIKNFENDLNLSCLKLF